MKTKGLDPDWQIKRPFRAFGIAFGVMSLLYCIAAPFIDDIPNRWLFLVGGICFSASLAFTIVGICLLQTRIRAFAFMGLAILNVLALAVGLGIKFIARFHPQHIFDAPLLVIFQVFPWTGGAALILLLMLASYGWYRHLHPSKQEEG